MSQNKPANSPAENQLLALLREHPDVLLQHPEVLQDLQLPIENGEVISLAQRQTRQLRDRNQILEKKLEKLTHIAASNERLLSRLHRLNLKLMSIDSVTDFLNALEQRLAEDFQTHKLAIALLPEIELNIDHPLLTSSNNNDPAWQELLTLKKPHCGRLTRAKCQALFGDNTQAVASVAVVPLSGLGLLAVGSDDAERFYPGMGTLFLSLLGETVAWRLQDEHHSQRRSA